MQWKDLILDGFERVPKELKEILPAHGRSLYIRGLWKAKK